MELDTVGGLVTALVSTYDDGLNCYTRWRRREWQTNHYQGRSRGQGSGSGGSCGLSTSLSVSESRLRQVYDSGADVLGDAFSTGDKQCRGALQANLKLLQTQVEALHRAARRDNAPLGLFEMIRASEAVRISSLRALTEQYQRVAVGRLVPRELPIRQPPSRQPSALSPSVEENAEGGLTTEVPKYDSDNGAEEKSSSGVRDAGASGREGPGKADDEEYEETGREEGKEGDIGAHITASHDNASPSKSPFQSEPPSPPLTPKVLPDDLQSTCTSELGPRPRASVFSVFCPEAMKYQVDLRKAMPSLSSTSSHGKKDNACYSRCGYRWSGTGNGSCAGSRDSGFLSNINNSKPATATTVIKDGFQLTPRFLGKSHCRSGGFGCVLCTSSGTTAVYDTVESLRDHINTSHDKWQMLHERDMVNR